jgi:hypothetical protein
VVNLRLFVFGLLCLLDVSLSRFLQRDQTQLSGYGEVTGRQHEDPLIHIRYAQQRLIFVFGYTVREAHLPKRHHRLYIEVIDDFPGFLQNAFIAVHAHSPAF